LVNYNYGIILYLGLHGHALIATLA